MRTRAAQARGLHLPRLFSHRPAARPFDSNSIPSTVILSPDGQVVARLDGAAQYDTPEFKACLEQLAATSGQ